MAPRHFDALLIGGGVAATRCARTLRRAGFDGSILLVGDEPVPPYNRPPLSKELLRDELPADLLLAEPVSWYERRGVELLLGTAVTSLDPSGRLVELADGRRLSYGVALLATGATARSPAFPGAEHALLLRSLGDAEAIRRRAAAGARAAVIGGGFIGVEVSASLAARGMQVTLLCGARALWSGAFGDRVSDWAAERLARAGVSVRFDAIATAVEATGVLLEAEHLDADLVIAGVGAVPRLDLAAAAGLAIDDGVLVAADHSTSVAGVYAAGDVARIAGASRVEHWHAARESGERAAHSMMGEAVAPTRAPWIFSEFAGSTLDVFGDPARATREEGIGDRLAAFLDGDRLVGLAVLDGALAPNAAREAVERGAAVADVARALAG